MCNVVIRPLDLDRDAESLAEMFNASDVVWPGGLIGGVPVTADRVREMWENERDLVVLVAEVDGKAVGLCSLMEGFPWPGEHPQEGCGEGYVEFLNLHPAYHGRGIGRKLVQATIDYSVRQGWKRQTLFTWSANTKAVPVYKKTGHFWKPGTEVWMQNFVPGALQMPIAQPFFEKHDWYDTMVRPTTLEEDDQRWEGLKVYEQRWVAEDASLTIWIDQEARAPIAVETDELLVAAIAQDPEPLCGSEAGIRWRVRNKTNETKRVYIWASGDQELQIDYRTHFDLPPKATVEREAAVRISNTAPRYRKDGTAPTVRSLIQIDDQEVELFPGFVPRRPLHLDTAPPKLSIMAQQPTRVNLQLHNETEQALTVRLVLTAPEGLSTDWHAQTVEIASKGHRSVPVEITAARSQVFYLAVHAEALGTQWAPIDERLAVFALHPGGVLADQREGVRLETTDLRVTLEPYSGVVRLAAKPDGERLIAIQPSFGPPYWPSEFQGQPVSFQVERDAQVRVRFEIEGRYTPGIFLVGAMVLSSNGLLTASYAIENRGTAKRKGHVRLMAEPHRSDAARVAIPLRQGLVRAPASYYPNWGDPPRDPNAYVEPWMAWDWAEWAVGIAWDEHIALIDGRHLQTREMEVAPGQRSFETRIALCPKKGRWSLVRAEALRWLQRQPLEKPLVERQVLDARVEPQVAVTMQDQVSLDLVVDSASKRPLDVQVHLSVDEPADIVPSSVHVEGLTRDKTLRKSVQAKLNLSRGVVGGQVRLVSAHLENSSLFHLVKLGRGGHVTIGTERRAGQELWIIDNGYARFCLCPTFGPSVVAWETAEGNILYSGFPEPRPFSWSYPWFGGIHPVLGPGDSHEWLGRLHKEAVTAMPVTAMDQCGLPWEGVRLQVQPKARGLQGLEVELDFLTVGEANVLKFIYRLRNLEDRAREFKTGGTVACALGADPCTLELHGPSIVRQPSPWGMTVSGARWGVLYNPATEQAMTLVGLQADIELRDAGQWGRLLGMSGRTRLEAKGTRERVYYLAHTRGLAQARCYAVLAEYRS